MAQDSAHWASVAAEWIAWARAPNHDSFWAYRGQLRTFLGRGPGRALDAGCGEGRVSRELKDLGFVVTAVDPVAALVAAAKDAASAHAYAVAPAQCLPFEDASFDLVVAYNVLMDVEDVPAALREMRRVTRADGRLVISIVHPFVDRGRFRDATADAPFEVQGSYFGRDRFEGVEERDGLRMHFAGWSQPLEAYTAALQAAGFAITRLAEPRPDLADGRARMARWTRLPLFLWLIARPVVELAREYDPGSPVASVASPPRCRSGRSCPTKYRRCRTSLEARRSSREHTGEQRAALLRLLASRFDSLSSHILCRRREAKGQS